MENRLPHYDEIKASLRQQKIIKTEFMQSNLFAVQFNEENLIVNEYLTKIKFKYKKDQYKFIFTYNFHEDVFNFFKDCKNINIIIYLHDITGSVIRTIKFNSCPIILYKLKLNYSCSDLLDFKVLFEVNKDLIEWK
jgi:hypothetical protein